MLSYLAKYPLVRAASAVGLQTPANDARIAHINDHLLYDSTPLIDPDKGVSVLYLDGEGTASAYVAERGAEIYLKRAFDRVVFTGARIPANDWKAKVVFPQVKADGHALPLAGQTEADYMKHIFLKALYEAAGKCKSLCTLAGLNAIVIPEGTNTGAKVRNSLAYEAFKDATAIQAVTLAYSQRRVHGTMRKELGDVPVISVEGVYPLGILKADWHLHALPYAVVMDEADKTGPRPSGKGAEKPGLYAPFFDDIDVAAETARIIARNASFV